MSAENYNRELLRAEQLIPSLSRWYFATSGQRMQPSFFIIGVQKGGTTALAQYLSEHPEIIQPQRKDIYFFNNCENFAKGLNWYQAHFAHRIYKKAYEIRHQVKEAITFDATPNYFAAPGAAQRLHSFYPNAKLILLLRNPTERAWSNFRMNKRHQFEPLDFEAALKAENNRISNEDLFAEKQHTHSYVRQRLAYRTNGVYAELLKEWLRYFHRDQFCIVRTEDLLQQTQETYNTITDFIGVQRFTGVKFNRYNEGGEQKEMPAASKQELDQFFAPHNQALEQLLQRNFNWNS